MSLHRCECCLICGEPDSRLPGTEQESPALICYAQPMMVHANDNRRRRMPADEQYDVMVIMLGCMLLFVVAMWVAS
jgi:hypothetical protein